MCLGKGARISSGIVECRIEMTDPERQEEPQSKNSVRLGSTQLAAFCSQGRTRQLTRLCVYYEGTEKRKQEERDLLSPEQGLANSGWVTKV